MNNINCILHVWTEIGCKKFSTSTRSTLESANVKIWKKLELHNSPLISCRRIASAFRFMYLMNFTNQLCILWLVLAEFHISGNMKVPIKAWLDTWAWVITAPAWVQTHTADPASTTWGPSILFGYFVHKFGENLIFLRKKTVFIFHKKLQKYAQVSTV